MKKANVITGVVFLALSVFAYMQAQKMVGKIMTDALGPGFWPKVLGLVMGVLSLALIAEGLFGKQAEGEKAPIAFGTEGFHRVLKLFAVLIVFGAILYFLGIYVGILFMMPLCMWLHGERNKKILVGLTVGSCLFIYLVFGLALRVPLPMGLLFS
ncbi:MAG: tripartite tricarboxylate transporter TctB family protein [Clostridiales bacterium]|nr:tripartite tricarboxylate transporter TctB family protein [Clostridiales bacterium]